MSWFGNWIERFRHVPNPYFSMHITAKFLVGGGLGFATGYLAANMDGLGIYYCRFANSHTKCQDCSGEVK